jgi:hypothetical protein
MTEALGRAVERGTWSQSASRFPQGRVAPTYMGGGGGHDLNQAGAVFAGDLSGPKTRVLLAVLLGAESSPAELRGGVESRGAQVGLGSPQAAEVFSFFSYGSRCGGTERTRTTREAELAR